MVNISIIETYFWCTLVPMILASFFYVLEAIEEAFYKQDHEHIEKFFMIFCSPLWPIYSIFASYWKMFESKIDPSDPEKEEEEIKKLTKMSNRGHLIEVCTGLT